MVKPEHARMVMETYTAADLSADRGEPVDLPLTNETDRAIADRARTGGERRRHPRAWARAEQSSGPICADDASA